MAGFRKAKAEGKVSFYANMTSVEPVMEAFQKKYGVKGVIWRAGSENILNRALQENRARRYAVDIVETNGPELESLSREKILAPHPHQDKADRKRDVAAPEHAEDGGQAGQAELAGGAGKIRRRAADGARADAKLGRRHEINARYTFSTQDLFEPYAEEAQSIPVDVRAT